MFQDVCDQREEDIEHPAEKQEFWLVSDGWGEVNGANTWKKWLIGVSVNVLCSGDQWRRCRTGLIAGQDVVPCHWQLRSDRQP